MLCKRLHTDATIDIIHFTFSVMPQPRYSFLLVLKVDVPPRSTIIGLDMARPYLELEDV